MSCYVLYSRAKAEIVAAENLRALGIAAYVPTKRKPSKTGKNWLKIPLFSSYVFIEAGPERIRDIEKVPQITRFVQIGKEYARLTPKDLETIKAADYSEEPVIVEQSGLIIGQQVEIQSGPFIGLMGIVVDPSRNNKVYLAIEGLRCYLSVESADLQYRVVKEKEEEV
ncbi:MAG: transcription termination/antitermination NusG family protein [Bacteroidia bacterium]|nr:transcription termination/antitermination NusG family protein [Bacteroidia bacterium]